jgi:hypothetical protein
MQTAELPSPAYIQRGNKSKSTPSGHIFPRREAGWSEVLKRRNIRTATGSMKQSESTSKPQRTALRLQPDIEP